MVDDEYERQRYPICSEEEFERAAQDKAIASDYLQERNNWFNDCHLTAARNGVPYMYYEQLHEDKAKWLNMKFCDELRKQNKLSRETINRLTEYQIRGISEGGWTYDDVCSDWFGFPHIDVMRGKNVEISDYRGLHFKRLKEFMAWSGKPWMSRQIVEQIPLDGIEIRVRGLRIGLTQEQVSAPWFKNYLYVQLIIKKGPTMPTIYQALASLGDEWRQEMLLLTERVIDKRYFYPQKGMTIENAFDWICERRNEDTTCTPDSAAEPEPEGPLRSYIN